MPTMFEIPEKVAARLSGKDADVAFQIAKSKRPVNVADEIIPIADWAEYRKTHDVIFSGRFDLQGRPIFELVQSAQ